MTRSVDQRSYRLTAIDMTRGLVIVIMALDHVRDYFHAAAELDPMANPNISAGLFFTRWITHFCAPVFVLLAGTSAGLMSARKTPGALARFLFLRGAWLIAIDMTVLSLAETFAPRGIPEMGGRVVIILQVLWAIGGSMVALSALSWLGRRVCLVLGVAILVGHNLLDPIWPVGGAFDTQWPLWVALHAPISVLLGPFQFALIYPVVAWIGVMLLGFGSSGLFELSPERRNGILLKTGLALTAAFVVLRAIGVYGDPNPWQVHPEAVVATAIDFLNVTKYPPSLLFLLMTLGPAAVLCATADRMTGWLKDALIVFGRVPFAFYIAHFYLIHTLSAGLGVVQGFSVPQMLTLPIFYPKGFGLTLPVVYVVWILIVALLYPPCHWMAGLKARRRDWWLSYV